MSFSLRWMASVSASALHAAEHTAFGRELVDPRLRGAVAEPAVAMQREILACQLPAERFWRQLLTHSHQFENNRELAAVAIRKSVGPVPNWEEKAVRIGNLIGLVEGAVLRAVPGIVDELANRARPIRELWEARGPGLLAAIGRRTDPGLIVDSAELVLVLPAMGGGGVAQLSNNSVRWEAVLTNPVEAVPEVVRLGWLFAQLHCDLPRHGEQVAPDRLPQVARFALIAPTLEAAEELELVSSHPAIWETALTAWQSELPNDSFSTVTEVIRAWWQTYQESRPAWNTALTALDRMLP